MFGRRRAKRRSLYPDIARECHPFQLSTAGSSLSGDDREEESEAPGAEEDVADSFMVSDGYLSGRLYKQRKLYVAVGDKKDVADSFMVSDGYLSSAR